MAGNYTLTIIKPDAFAAGKAGKIIAHLEQQGFKILTSGPCMPILLEKSDAVAALRTAIGATDPAQADAGTVRKLYAESKERNAIHASDSDENATREARFFFAETEVLAAR
jgi:nucleoside-diphosphate kinase